MFTDRLTEIFGLTGVEKSVSDIDCRPVDIQIQVGDVAKLKAKRMEDRDSHRVSAR